MYHKWPGLQEGGRGELVSILQHGVGKRASVVNDACERCGTVAEAAGKQWFFRITKYADRLLDNLDKLDGWPETVKIMQANWISTQRGCGDFVPRSKALMSTSRYLQPGRTPFSERPPWSWLPSTRWSIS